MPISDHISKFTLQQLQNGHLSLVALDNSFTPFSIDFTTGKNWHRLKSLGKKQPLARAIGIKQPPYPHVIDATAGMGTDGFLLAALGCQVTLIEQSEIVTKLLEDALRRARANIETRAIAQRINLHAGDACDMIPALPPADVIYLDPMFPESTSSAKVKKPMQLLQQLVGHQSEESLLTTAKQHAPRVVLKRPRKLLEFPPNNCQIIQTKTTQFWIFLTAI